MPDHPDRSSLEALRAFDTPTICNALEIVARRAARSGLPGGRWSRRFLR